MRLQQALGSRVVEANPLPVGFGLTGLAITLADGRRLAVKAGKADHGGADGLKLEAFMLGELARLSELPVPRVHHAARDLLVMDYIENDGGEISESVERHAGELIARLHATPRERFGYSRDTLIVALYQPTHQTPLLVPFFRHHRRLYMTRRPYPQASRAPHLLPLIKL